MNRVPVQSSHLVSVGYESQSHTLEVAFRDGAVYHYFEVPEAVFEALIAPGGAGGSVGAYFDVNVKKAGYRYEEI